MREKSPTLLPKLVSCRNCNENRTKNTIISNHKTWDTLLFGLFVILRKWKFVLGKEYGDDDLGRQGWIPYFVQLFCLHKVLLLSGSSTKLI